MISSLGLQRFVTQMISVVLRLTVTTAERFRGGYRRGTGEPDRQAYLCHLNCLPQGILCREDLADDEYR